VERTCPTITLVRDRGVVMVVDPGVLDDQRILSDALRKEGLSVGDVNFVCITHSHIDHCRNAGMFSRARVLEFYGIWDGGRVVDWNENFTRDIKIIKTPGHDKTSITLLVKTAQGVVAVAGDVFWKEDFPRTPEDDAYADDMDALRKTRKAVLAAADYIVPGHAGMYKVRK
jgi:glyoxylase-like metal-dependent hydrolase (beta-lactamase superfamily II)